MKAVTVTLTNKQKIKFQEKRDTHFYIYISFLEGRHTNERKADVKCMY